MLLNLSPSTDKAAGVMRELGIITADGANRFFDASGKAKSLAEISGVLQDATKGLTEQQKLQALQTIFGTDAIRAAAIMAKAGSEGFTEMAQSIGKVTAEAVAAERLNNLKGDIEQLTGSLETAGIKIGTAFLPGLRQITQGATTLVNETAPLMEAFAKRASDGITEASRQIQDAWRTAKQAFAGEWLPSDEIPPFVNLVGQAAMAVRDFGEWLGTVATKARDVGALDAFASGMANVADESERVKSQLGEIGHSFELLHEALGKGAGEADLMAGALRVLGTTFEEAALMSAELIDAMLTMAQVGIDLTSMVVAAGRAVVAFASGDMPAMESALAAGDAAFADLAATIEGFSSRSSARVGEAFQAIAGYGTSGMAETQAAVESGMSGVVGAIEGAAPAAEAAGAQVGAAAVAGVQGQAGAASAAGASVGDSIGSGMLAGIRSWVGSIASAAASLVSSAIGAARAEAEARSPSKKTEKLGKDLAQGLEIGLNSSNIGEEMQRKIRDFIAASREYIPTAHEIARVEEEIKFTREQSQTEALFRAERMIVVDSESLRLKEDMARKERDILSTRQDLARTSREIEDAERGLLGVRQYNLAVAGNVAANNIQINELERQKIPLVSRSLQIERELLGITKDTEPAKRLQIEQEEIRKRIGLIDNTISQQRLLTRSQELDAASNREASTVAATAGRIRKEAIEDASRAQQRLIDDIKMQIDVLGAERAVFDANENVIKNATQNEIDYRNRLIAVFKSEATPLTDRIKAGLALVDQLQKEGRISNDLANAIKNEAQAAGQAAGANVALGQSAQVAAPALATAATQADRMAAEAADVARRTAEASRGVDALSSSLGRLPSWFHPTGAATPLFRFAGGGRPPVGVPSLVGERGAELFVPDRAGTILPADTTRAWMGSGGRGAPQSIRVDVAIGGKVARQIVVEGYDLAVRQGWTPGGLTG
jgi:hypothetical protein